MNHASPVSAGGVADLMEPRPPERARARPILHFTVQRGWTNDPHGIIHFGGKYHMFFQYNPTGLAWDKACHWGHAISDELLTWSELPVALTPEREVGCWSGSAVVDGDEATILYTSIRHQDLGRGAVALARSRGDLLEWKRANGPDVITGPPDGLAVRGFRDPFVWRVEGGWKALLGAGIIGFGGTVLQYRSSDLAHWEFEGAIAERSRDDVEPVWTGAVWECPQLMEIDGEWLLVVSVWDDDVIHHVAHATGSYDGSTFVPGHWRRLTHGPSAYATSLFRDADGRPVAISWLRERDNTVPADSPWASAMSLPYELTIDNGELQARFHRCLRSRLGTPVTLGQSSTHSASGTFLVTATGALSGDVLVLRSHGQELTVCIDDSALTISDPTGEVLLSLPRTRLHALSEIELCIDADILEVTWSDAAGIGSARVCAASAFTIDFPGSASDTTALLREAREPVR